ncbi:MAG: abortive infection family protein [Bacteroidetes bacterium]|nr:abortive infection family protein [Bacteroidota bacterium]
MADLTYIEKATIENFLGMKSGYVMDFSDRTFNEFVGCATGLDIDTEKYYYGSNSKANRLRGFIKVESNYVFAKLLSAFCDYWLSKVHSKEIDYRDDENAYKECLKIVERLNKEKIVENIEAIQPNSEDKDFALLAKSIKESIEKNEPEAALDRLHTFVVKYVRQLCENHGLSHDKDEPINSLFGKYVKHLVTNKLIDSLMAEKILKFSINIIDAFNDVRNNKSFAHDNPILNYHESILIFNNISNTIKYIETLENKIQATKQTQQADWKDLPF